MTDQLSWPPPPTWGTSTQAFWIGVYGSAIGIVLVPFWGSGCMVLIFTVPALIYGALKRGKETEERNQARVAREQTIEKTGASMIGEVKYVGGHPLIPETRQIVLALLPETLALYSLLPDHLIEPITTVPIDKIDRVGTGRPRSATEIFHEESSSTIDVIEGSPFLHVAFDLEGDDYTVSFSDFETGSPVDWSNKIISLRHEIRHSGSS